MLATLLALGPSFLKPEFWFDKAGAAAIWVVVAIIFAESGLLIGFFLPGDSLLFFTGFLTSPAAADSAAFAPFAKHVPALPIVLVLLFVAAVAGDQVGYLFGKKVGPALFNRPNSRLFKQEHLVKAHEFFEHHGAKSILLARFVPIVRTFTPIVAGVSDMRDRTFVKYNVIGGFVWAIGVTSLGHFLGQVTFIRDNIEYAIIVLVAISLLPMVVEVLRHRRNAKRAHAEARSAVPAAASAVGTQDIES
jgi:membrane-associated protein